MKAKTTIIAKKFLAGIARAKKRLLFARNQRDTKIINRHARRLNQEAIDTLAYQRIKW